MVSSSSSFKHVPDSPSCKRRGDALSPRPLKRHRLGPLPDGNDTKRRSCTSGNRKKAVKGHQIQKHRTQLHRGMLDISTESLVMIGTYLDSHDLWALTVTSRSMCQLLLPDYLCRRGLVLKDGGSTMELRDLTGYVSLGLCSAAHTFEPPEEMYCSIPCSTQEARGAMAFLTRFLLEPSNTCNLRDFNISLHGSNPLLLTSGFIELQRVFYTLPLTRLCFSGYGSESVDCLPPSITLRSRSSCIPPSLTSFIISSDFAFARGLAQTTLSILRCSPIKSLTIQMVSLKSSQWSILFGELSAVFLEDIELEGDIPRPALIRFLMKSKALRNIRIRCNAPIDCIQPSRSLARRQSFLPNLLTLHAPLAVCCDIAGRMSNSSRIYEVDVEMNQLQPHHPSFRRLLETLHRFRSLEYLGLRFAQSLPCAAPQDWDGCPACELTQIRSLRFFRGQGRLSHGDIDTICAYVRSFPAVETVFVAEGGDIFRMQVLDSLRKAKPSLRTVTVYSGSTCLKWTTDDYVEEHR